jgi:hypothetical protein
MPRGIASAEQLSNPIPRDRGKTKRLAIPDLASPFSIR